MKRNRSALVLLLFISLFSVAMSFARPVEASWLSDFFDGGGNGEDNIKEMAASVKSASEGVSSRSENSAGMYKAIETTAFFSFGGVSDELAYTYNLTEEEKLALQKTYGHGAIGDLNNGIAMLFTKPADTQTYVADVFRSAKIIPPAQAQGLGFAALDPILSTWKVIRNVAYLFFVIIFLIIGFMIMFRQKMGGQAVVTAQQAIPGIIVSLVLVTFSYAIAGFMIDIMYLVMYLMIGMFSANTELIDQNFLQLGMGLVTGSGGVNSSAFSTVNDAVTDFVGAIDLGSAGDALGWISGITFGLIVTIAILIGVFKLFFELLKTYITIILTIAFAPMMIMMGAIPGKNTFMPWLKMLIGNLAAFPTVLLMLILYNEMTKNTGSITEGGFMPPYLMGQGFGGALTTLVGIGIILVMPDAVKKVKAALGAKSGVWEEMASAAVNNAKDGWSGKGVPGGFGAKKIMKAPFAAGAMAGGAGLGAYGAGKMAESKYDLSPKQLNAVRAVGGLTGAVAAPKVGEVAKSLFNRYLPQIPDTGLKMAGEQLKSSFKTSRNTARQESDENVIKEQDKASEVKDPTQGYKDSEVDLEGLV